MCFTQNIDTLERRAGVPIDEIVEAHGSFATQRCIECKHPYPDEAMQECILGPTDEKGEPRIPRCERKKCGGLVKPDIVFFGEGVRSLFSLSLSTPPLAALLQQLPDRFHQHYRDVADADLLIILGTSLTVHPFAALAGMANQRKCRRVLINLERVGDLGQRKGAMGDIVLLGECDAIVKELCAELGWSEELDGAWAETEGTVRDAAAKDKGKEKELVGKPAEKERDLKKEMEEITVGLEKKLDIIRKDPHAASTGDSRQESYPSLTRNDGAEGVSQK